MSIFINGNIDLSTLEVDELKTYETFYQAIVNDGGIKQIDAERKLNEVRKELRNKESIEYQMMEKMGKGR